MITRIEAFRYRCFERLSVSLDQFQVFVGPNGSGKTTLLDIPIALGEMLKSRSIEAAFLRPTASHVQPRADSGSDLIYKRASESFVLTLEAQLPENIASALLEKQAGRRQPRAVEALRKAPHRWPSRIRYEIEIEMFNDALQIAQEYLLLLSEGADTKTKGPTGLIGEWLSARSSKIIPVISRPKGGMVRFYPEAEPGGERNDSSDRAGLFESVRGP